MTDRHLFFHRRLFCILESCRQRDSFWISSYGVNTAVEPYHLRPCSPCLPCGFLSAFHWYSLGTISATGKHHSSNQSEPIKFPVKFLNKFGTWIPFYGEFLFISSCYAKWKLTKESSFCSALMAGILPFGAMFIELFFIFSAIWENQFYYLFGFLFLVFIILAISCSQIAIVMVYFQLCGEVNCK